MTFQPPPPPPPGGPTPPPPAGQPYGAPPPGQQWGAPPPSPGYRPPGPGFDAKSINPLDWGIVAAGVLTFIFSFFSYYTATASAFGYSISVHENAWHGFFGWFGMLLALASSALVAVSIMAPSALKLPVPARLAALGGYALALICLILAWFITPGVAGSVSGVNFGRGFGFYGSLILVLAGLVLCLLRFQQTGGQLPGALAKMPTVGGHRTAAPPPPPPGGPGYGPPPQGGPGYVPPPPPPAEPGYGPPPPSAP